MFQWDIKIFHLLRSEGFTEQSFAIQNKFLPRTDVSRSFLYTQQIEVKLAAINVEFDSI